MTPSPCPPPLQLSRFVDADIEPETADRIGEHLGGCEQCRRQVDAQRRLIADLRAPIVVELDVRAHTQDVIRRLGGAPLPRRRQTLARLAVAGSLAAAASWVGYVALQNEPLGGTLQARGAGAAPSLSRDVGVQIYSLEQTLRPIVPGETIAASTSFTAGLRNLGQAPAHVLVFAVDSRNQVHWITPLFTRADQDPEATVVPHSPEERLLETSVVFNLAAGPLRLITILASRSTRVSAVETLPASELAGPGLGRRLPGAEIRELAVEVSHSEPGTHR